MNRVEPGFHGESKMRQFSESVLRFLRSEDGPTSVEYCVMAAFIVVVCFVTIGEIGDATLGLYVKSKNALP